MLASLTQHAAFADASTLAPSTLESAMLATMRQDPAIGETIATDTSLRFTFTPGVWLARLGGESTFGGLPGAREISLETQFELDDRETAPNFELAITKGSRWQIDLGGFDFSTSGRGEADFTGPFGDIAITPGDAYRADFDMTSLALSVSYWQWHPINSVDRGGSLDLRLAWGGGIRWLSVEQSLELPGTDSATTGDGEWLIPEAIIQLDLNYRLPDSFPVLQNFQIISILSIGPAFGGDGGLVATFRSSMRFWLSDCFSLDFGYRLIEASVESEEYELTGGLQGLFLSGTIRF